MQYQFYMPVKIVSGEDCIKKHADLFAPFGKRVLVVTGKSSAKNGALEDVVHAFNLNAQSYEVYDSVPPNPTVESVQEGARIARDMRADLVVAIGGGSPMDAAKAVAMLARQGVQEGDVFAHKITDDVLPMIHVPTTAGTGSEVTPYAILTNDEKQTKTSISSPALFPKIAEGMLSVRAGALSDALARQSLRVLLGELPALLSGHFSYESRKNLLFGAMLAGTVIANTGTSPVHGMGYCLTYFHDVPHGRANGLLLPVFLEICARKDPARTAPVLEALGMPLQAFSENMAALFGRRECYDDATLRGYAARAAQGKNIKNCAVHFEEADLYEVFSRSVGGR